MTKTLSLTQARSRFSSLVDKSDRLSERFIVTKNGTPKAIVMGAEKFERWVETLELLSNAKVVKCLAQGLKEAQIGNRSFKDVFSEEK
jgi:antitoxin YefM